MYIQSRYHVLGRIRVGFPSCLLPLLSLQSKERQPKVSLKQTEFKPNWTKVDRNLHLLFALGCAV